MGAAAINGVRLHMNFEVDDTALMDKVDEIISAIGSIDDGASEVRDGAGKLHDTTKTLNGKVGDLNSGVGALTDGAGDLFSGLSDITAKNGQLTAAAYSAYEGLCTAAAAALNSQLEANGREPVTLTPPTYAAVLRELLEQMNADDVYDQAYQAARQQVTVQVEAQADTLYRGYVESQADAVYLAYVSSQADTLYAQVAAQAVYAQLIQSGYTDEQASAFLQSPEGQAAVANMTEEQKAQIVSGAVAQLTDEQKEQILQGAVASLTDEQKAQIKDAYIQQMMASDEVTAKINAAVAAVSAAARQVSELKGQLDSYGAFYQSARRKCLPVFFCREPDRPHGLHLHPRHSRREAPRSPGLPCICKHRTCLSRCRCMFRYQYLWFSKVVTSHSRKGRQDRSHRPRRLIT